MITVHFLAAVFVARVHRPLAPFLLHGLIMRSTAHRNSEGSRGAFFLRVALVEIYLFGCRDGYSIRVSKFWLFVLKAKSCGNSRSFVSYLASLLEQSCSWPWNGKICPKFVVCTPSRVYIIFTGSMRIKAVSYN